MLVRISGGNSGIAEYLITGKKIGREKTRDELDKRVILSGDLDVTDTIINSIDDNGQERYLHITLSFRESDVSNEVLEEITSDYKKLLMSAYGEDEFNFYAEAHLPKIKNTIDYRTGELVERKPHIHIVIPKTNLLTEKYLNPVGLINRNIVYFDAIQETINRKYNLESPKDFLRNTSNNHEQVIARMTGELLSEKNGQFKNELAKEVFNKNITSFQSFKELLEDKGEVVVRNSGKDNEYLAIKIDGQKRFINLKSKVFSKEFIENGVINKLPIDMVEDHLYKWQTKVSKEIKYISNASSKVKKEYSQLTEASQLDFLNKREKQYEYRYRRNDSKPDINAIRRTNSPSIASSVPKMQELYVLRGESGRERPRQGSAIKLLYGNESNSLGVKQSKKLRSMRWDELSSSPSTGGIKSNVNVLDQVISENKESYLIENATHDFKEIRLKLDANYLLNELRESHLLTDNFVITKAKDGSYRIRDGNRNYNVSDFLTKKVNLSWNEAKIILINSYDKQLNNYAINKLDNNVLSNKELWLNFKSERLTIIKDEIKQEWINIRDKYRKDRRYTIDYYYKINKDISINRALKKADKIAQRSINTYNKIVALKELKDEYFSLKNSLKSKQKSTVYYFEKYKKEVMDMGIMDRLFNHDDLVLKSPSILISSQVEQIEENKKNVERLMKSKLGFKPDKKDKKGYVTYILNDGERAFIDKGTSIEIPKKEQRPDKMLYALEMAIAKFGKTIELEGNEQFKEALIELAAIEKIDVVFKPEKYQQLLNEKNKGINDRLNELGEEGYLTIGGQIYTLDEMESYRTVDSIVSHYDDTKDAIANLIDNAEVKVFGSDKFKEEAIGLLTRYAITVDQLDIHPKELQAKFDEKMEKIRVEQAKLEAELEEEKAKQPIDIDDFLLSDDEKALSDTVIYKRTMAILNIDTDDKVKERDKIQYELNGELEQLLISKENVEDMIKGADNEKDLKLELKNLEANIVFINKINDFINASHKVSQSINIDELKENYKEVLEEYNNLKELFLKEYNNLIKLFLSDKVARGNPDLMKQTFENIGYLNIERETELNNHANEIPETLITLEKDKNRDDELDL